VADEGANLYIVEIVFGDKGRDDSLTAVPRHLELRILLMDILCQLVDTPGIAVAAHEGDAGEVGAVLIDEVVDGIRIQRQSDVLPKVMAMTPRTVTRTIRDVNCQCHFVGYLLEYDVGIDVLQHRLVCHSVVTT